MRAELHPSIKIWKFFPKLFFYSLASLANPFQLTLNHKSTMIKAQTHLPTKTCFFSCVGGVMKFSNIGETNETDFKTNIIPAGQLSIFSIAFTDNQAF